MMSLFYRISSVGQGVVFTCPVISHFKSNRQFDNLPEVGGQLFGILKDSKIFVMLATGPYPEDKCSKYSFLPSRKREAKDIKSQFRQGLHYLGDWHTHPQGVPEPSSTDLQSMKECFLKSRHEHQSFLMVIVGTNPPPRGFHVSAHNRSGFEILRPDKKAAAM